MEPKLSFPKEMRMITTSIHNAVNPQDMNYCTATNEHRIQHHERTIKQHLDRAHKVSTQRSPRRSNAIQPTREQYNAAHEGATQHSPRRSTTKTGYTPDCLKTKINQQEPLGFGRAELKARRREEDWIEIGGKSTYIRPMHGEEAATLTLKLLPMSGSVSNVS